MSATIEKLWLEGVTAILCELQHMTTLELLQVMARANSLIDTPHHAARQHISALLVAATKEFRSRS